MTTLPAINKENRNTSASTKSKTPRSSLRNTKFMTWKEKEALKHKKIREEKPTLSKVDTSMYRNSYKHNLCIGMLKAGFHKSFHELFNLIENRKKQRLEAGVNSILWQEKSLDVQEEKLDQLWLYLTKGESATRIGKWEEVYNCRNKLAEYFLEKGDKWLADHFFQTSLETSLNIRLDGRRRESEAHCNMGLSCERNGDLDGAAEHLERYYQLTVGRAWTSNGDVTHGSSACRHLSRVYTTLADQSHDVLNCQSLLHRANEMAKEGEDPLQEARAALRLGLNYEQTKDSATAIKHLSHCLEMAQSAGDDLLVGETCEALAKSYQTQGDVPRAVEFLELFADTSRRTDHKQELVDASNCLGTIYNSMGDYQKAVGHFTSAYETSNEIMQSNESSLVQLGVARGNQMLNAFKQNMEASERVMMSRIASWKDERCNEFGDPLPTNPVTPKPTPQPTPDPTQPFRDVDPSKSSH